MARNSKPGTARIDLDVSAEAKLLFTNAHEALGYKTKAETFEAIVYAISMKDKIDPLAIERVERKLDLLFEHLGDFA